MWMIILLNFKRYRPILILIMFNYDNTILRNAGLHLNLYTLFDYLDYPNLAQEYLGLVKKQKGPG